MSWPRSPQRFGTPRDPSRLTRADLTLAHLTRLTRSRPHPWQWDVAEVAGELNDALDGFRYSTVILSVPRRAGKTTLGLATLLDRLDLIPDARCWYTCTNGREVAAKVFRDEWVPMVEPLARFYRLRRAQGSEGIHKRYGGSSRAQLFAPSGDALHSTNVDTAIVDEAFAASIEVGEAIEAGLTPAQLTRPWRQTWIVSAGGTIESAWWDRWLTAGAQSLPGVAMFDYGADSTDPNYDPASPEIWARSHPTAGIAFPLSVLQHLWDTRRDDASFERAYLNVWPRPSEVLASSGVDPDAWRAAAEPSAAAEPIALAVDVAADRSRSSIAQAGRLDGRVAIEVLDNRSGTSWVAKRIREIRGRRPIPVLADSLVAAGIVAELERQGVKVTAIGASEHARACGSFVDRLAADLLRHRAQEILDAAVAASARRPLGDAWLWSRQRSTADISPLVAATLAAWGASTARTPGKAQVVSAPVAT